MSLDNLNRLEDLLKTHFDKLNKLKNLLEKNNITNENKKIGEYPNISELKIPDNTRIISLSDIHGDIHSLIIALRDCGEVISKENFINSKEDAELEQLLEIDISEKDNGYVDSLNYKWIGRDTHVVIVGDFLDCKREGNNIFRKDGFGQNEYPQIEIKIFRFINAINKQAQKSGGRIIKIFGNHELMNIIKGTGPFITRYSYPNTIKQINYYRGYNRIECFNYGNEGYKLMLEDGMYILFKINNNLFVHGGPTDDYDFNNYNTINYKINTNNIEDDLFIKLNNNGNENSPLWNRLLGDNNKIEERIYNNDIFCNNVKQLLTKIKGNNYFNDDIKTMRIIIGHCVQNSSTINNIQNTTFSYINEEVSDDIKEVLEPKLETVIKDNKRIIPKKLNLLDDKNQVIIKENNKEPYQDVKYRGYADLEKRIVFGITMECDNDLNSADNYIYKVDVGASRGFDNSIQIPQYSDLSEEELENKYFLSRTPQILEIINNKPRIVRSLVNNTKIHQPRIKQSP
jgi:hypothetical protein